MTTSLASGELVPDVLQLSGLLLGLPRRRPLDVACPNISLHRILAASSYHVLD